MTKTDQQDLSVLTAAKNGLVYLTPNDWALIVDKAARVRFKAGDNIVERDRRTHGIYLLLSGAAAVQIAPFTSPTIGPVETCGVLSFLDERRASASVVAQGLIDAYYRVRR